MKAPALFSPEDFDKLVSETPNEFIAVPHGKNFLIYSTGNDFQYPVGIYHPAAERIQYFSFGTKHNPLVEYMMDNSLLTPEQYRHVDSGKELDNVIRANFSIGGFIWGALLGGYGGYKIGLLRKQQTDVFKSEREAVQYLRRAKTKKMAAGGLLYDSISGFDSVGTEPFDPLEDLLLKDGGNIPSPYVKAQAKFIAVMREFGKRKLHHGTTGEIVTDQDMAVAIAYSEARKIDPKFGDKHIFGGKVSRAVEYTFDNEFGATTTILISPIRDNKWRVQIEIKELHPTYNKPSHKQSGDFWLPEDEVQEVRDKILQHNPKIKKY